MLGADHHGYVGRLQALAEMLGHPRDTLEVLIYQLVHLTRGGEASKMSKRRGDVVFLDDFVDEIGVDAARWYLVSRGHDQTIEIDVDLAAEKSQEPGLLRPVRPCTDRRDPAQRPVDVALDARCGRRAARAGGARPRQAARRIPGARCRSAERRAPHAIPTYAIRLADDFHRFYHQHKVLGVARGGVPLGLCARRDVVAPAST